MKKIAGLLCAAMAALTMSSCGNPTLQTMYEMYMKASQAMHDADSILLDTAAVMSTEYQGELVTLTMNGSIAEVIRSETDIDMKLDMKTSVMGQDVLMEAFYTEGMYYVNTMGQKVKMPMPVDQMVQQANTQAFDFPETAIKNEAVTDVEVGKKLSFTLDGAALSVVLKRQLSGLEGMIDLETGVTFGDVNLEAVIDKDDNMRSTRIVFPMYMTMEGESMTLHCDISMTIVKLGGVTVTFPDDLDTYGSY